MRTLELRLEDVETIWSDAGVEFVLTARATKDYATQEQARLFAALEFFDRALISYAIERHPQGAFEDAAALTLLRFGVRIVGLEEESHG